MERTEQHELRLAVLARYQRYVQALRTHHLDPSARDVRDSRRALARAIEEASSRDPNVLSDFKRAFASRPHA